MVKAKAILGSVVVGIEYLVGGVDQALYALLVLMAVDFVTGWLASAVGRSKNGMGLSSKVGLTGIAKKVVMLGLVILANTLDQTTGTEIARRLVIAGLTANEGLSILENAAAIGVPIPSFLKAALETMRQKNDNSSTNFGGDAP